MRICGPTATIRSCRMPPGAPAMPRISRSSCRSRRAIRIGANVRFLIDNAALPADSDSYERVVLVFNGDDAEALAAARENWTACKARGFEVTYWQADERGRWQRRQ